MLELGLVGTEMLYFAVGELGLDGGIVVTASHNPKEYTGHEDRPRAARSPSAASRDCSAMRDRALSARARDRRRGTVRR